MSRSAWKRRHQPLEPLPLLPHIRRGTCPWCGLPIVVDDRRHVTSHQEPVCSGWWALMQQARDELGEDAVRPIGHEVLSWGSDDTEPS